MKTEQDFLEWLSGATIYIGYARYAQFGGHGFVCVSEYDDTDILSEAVSNLDAGDIEALEAARFIEARGCWWGSHPDPADAMIILVEQMRGYYFDELNNQVRQVLSPLDTEMVRNVKLNFKIAQCKVEIDQLNEELNKKVEFASKQALQLSKYGNMLIQEQTDHQRLQEKYEELKDALEEISHTSAFNRTELEMQNIAKKALGVMI